MPKLNDVPSNEIIWFVTVYQNNEDGISTEPYAQGIYTSAKQASVELASIGIIQGAAEEATLYTSDGEIASLIFTGRDYQAVLCGMPEDVGRAVMDLDSNMWSVPDVLV